MAILDGLHAGGIEFIVELPTEQVDQAITRLRTCHDHVFIVDQSMGSDRTRLGVSPRGATCLEDEFKETR